MKRYFYWVAQTPGRWIKGTIGLALLALGYVYGSNSPNIYLVALGIIMIVLAVANLVPFALLAGLPISGKNILFKAQQQYAKKVTGDQGHAKYKTGSTTQGGSNYGQGSMQLDNKSYKQGSEKNEGANYGNEANRLGNEDSSAANK